MYWQQVNDSVGVDIPYERSSMLDFRLMGTGLNSKHRPSCANEKDNVRTPKLRSCRYDIEPKHVLEADHIDSSRPMNYRKNMLASTELM